MDGSVDHEKAVTYSSNEPGRAVNSDLKAHHSLVASKDVNSHVPSFTQRNSLAIADLHRDNTHDQKIQTARELY